MKESASIFLSYARQDHERVFNLYQKLASEGFTPWMDSKNILPGEKRTASIQKAIRESDFFLACLSVSSTRERGFFQSQVKDALSLLKDMLDSDIYLIPVRLEECDIPEYFEELQGADIYTEDGWSQLLEAIQEGLDRRRTSGMEATKSLVPGPNVASVKPYAAIEISQTWKESEQDPEEGVVLLSPHRDVTSKLPFKLESEHFIIHFGLRNPTAGKGLGPDGVRDRALILTYTDALERCYKVMISQPWARQPPIAGPNGKTTVYIFDTAPFTAFNLQVVPYICLPSGSNEPTGRAEWELASATAVHQVAHVFNYRERPFYDMNSGAWAWFDDALAYLIESLVLSDNYDHFRLLSEWINSQGESLDNPSARVQTIPFIRYLASRLGVEFVNKIWTQSLPAESPLEALVRMLPEGERFSSSDPNVRDLFASGFCMDSYFLWDPSSYCFMPQLFQRYGDRAISESFLLGAGVTVTIENVVDHLSCRYYRFHPKERAARLQIVLSPEGSDTVSPLKAEVAIVTKEKLRGNIEPLHIVPSSRHKGAEQLACNIPFSLDYLEHIVLVVSNCGRRGYLERLGTANDDNKRYSIMISVN